MLCSSPISANTWSSTVRDGFSAAGMCRPLWPITCKRPSVLSETVLPPVLGPVITSVVNSFPSLRSIGTTFFLSIKGCLACRMAMIPSSLKTGLTAFISLASLAFAKIKSRSLKSVKSSRILSSCRCTCPESSWRIRMISSFSSDNSSEMRLFI